MTARTLEDLGREDVERKTGATGAHPGNAPLAPVSAPVVVDAAGLLAADFPPRERLLSPWLLSQSLSMLYAPRGVGKTHVALGVAYALASGGAFLGWRAEKPVPVLYLDGEMPGADLRDRLRRIAESADRQAEPGSLLFMTPDLQPDGIMPNLFTYAGQQEVTDAAPDSGVIIVDNISALVRGGKENEGESWQPVAEWALRMRSSGRSVVFIHHAGKTGQQRGTSKREDLQPDGIMPNLFTYAGQQEVTDAAPESGVIIVDNISALVRGGKENEGESWQPVAEWALRMRSSGRSVVFIHHAGKTGQQRGTSKREDLLDTVIALRRPADYTPDQGARFEVHIEKARALYGEDVAPVEAMLETGKDGRQSWTLRAVSDASEAQMIELAGLGLSAREIGAELGVNHSTVVRGLRKAEKEGRYTPKPRNKGGRPKLSVVKGGKADPCAKCDGEGCEWCR